MRHHFRAAQPFRFSLVPAGHAGVQQPSRATATTARPAEGGRSQRSRTDRASGRKSSRAPGHGGRVNYLEFIALKGPTDSEEPQRHAEVMLLRDQRPLGHSSPRWAGRHAVADLLASPNEERPGDHRRVLPQVATESVHPRLHARRGEEVALLDAANYNDVMAWIFRADGVVEGRVGATARNLPGAELEAHMHNPFWRLDIDLNGFSGDSVHRGTHTENLPGPTATDSDPIIPTAIGVKRDPLRFTSMHVHDSALKNGKGHASMYHLMPLRWGSARHQEAITRRTSCGRAGSSSLTTCSIGRRS